ncbi:molecular chaperone [Pseudomonas wayambapalatensis]|nr:molecular chaperone [Pseudomonas wayambapalatensis]
MGIRSLMALLLALPLSLHAAPELNIGGLYDYLEGDRSTLLKRVRNGGDTTAFVKISVVELVYDADGQAREVATDGLALEQRGLVVSPARLIVPAGGMQAVRLLYRGPRDQERYYRLRFLPVLPERGDDFAVDEQQASSYREHLQAGVNLLAGYGSLLFVRPQQPRFDTRIRRQGGQLEVTNAGNASVVLDRFRQCHASAQTCDAATKHHLLPGRSRQFSGHVEKEHRFDLHEGAERRDVVVEG